MRYKAVAPAVIDYLMTLKPGNQFTAEHIAAQIDKTPAQVAAVISGRIRDGRLQAAVVVRGHAWIYQGMGATKPAGKSVGPLIQPTAPASPPPSSLYELVRVLKDGAALLEDETGELWVARKLEAR